MVTISSGWPARRITRQEDHSDTIISYLRQGDSLQIHFSTEKSVRNLRQNSCAIPQQRIVTSRAAMLQILQYLKALDDNGVAFLVQRHR